MEPQVEELSRFCTASNIIQEKATGTDIQARPLLQNFLKNAREGDILIVTRLDRLARSTLDLTNIATELKDKKAHLKILDNEALDTSSAHGELMFTVLGAIAQFETQLRAERQRVGIEAAKKRGVYKGRKPLSYSKIKAVRELIDDGMSVTKACKEIGIGRTAYYKYLNQ
ncbi:MAG: recombinase family protein [Gammaproteobacteria bacterium]